mmetsp:Transcript_18982/g.60642  ORF Transcript_18982/g.60642 Transcript_18982/m.60642 type:complete len:208 (+) Transcript_18982:246-869(+)
MRNICEFSAVAYAGTGRPRSQRSSMRASARSASRTSSSGSVSRVGVNSTVLLTSALATSSLSLSRREVATAAASSVPADMSVRRETHTRCSAKRAFAAVADRPAAVGSGETTLLTVRRRPATDGVFVAKESSASSTGGVTHATAQSSSADRDDSSSSTERVEDEFAAAKPSHSACCRPARRCGCTSVCMRFTRVRNTRSRSSAGSRP